MIVECIGLPGSGKSHLLRSVAEELTGRGVPCVNAGERSMMSPLWKAGKKVLHRTIFLSREARETRDRMRKILAEAGPSDKSGTTGRTRQEGRAGHTEQEVRESRTGRAEPDRRAFPLRSRYGINTDERFTVESAAIFAAAYRRMARSRKVYLFDEGLVHTIVKFCAEFHLPDKVFTELLAACGTFRGDSRIVVYNEISLADCIESIRKRDRHICAFDELSGDRLRELLQQYDRLNACYAAREPVLTVSRTEEERGKRGRICEEILRRRR